MDLSSAERIVAAVLYEGYILYPYRASSVKNRQRFSFGTLYPRAFCEGGNPHDAWTSRTECLVAVPGPVLEIRVRFLHTQAREVRRAPAPGEPPSTGELVESLAIGDQVYQTWQEVIEREVAVADVRLSDLSHPRTLPFVFAGSEQCEMLRDETGGEVGSLVRRLFPVHGIVEISAERLQDALWKLNVSVSNTTPAAGDGGGTRDAAVLQSLASTHTILRAQEGEFVSLLDPPAAVCDFAARCTNVGTWPVLVGVEPARNLMLSSPIILYDYPQVAPESPGDFFDLTEMDEMLSLRVKTLTDDEKQRMRSLDDRAQRILQRTENLDEHRWLELHGARRDRPAAEGDPQ